MEQDIVCKTPNNEEFKIPYDIYLKYSGLKHKAQEVKDRLNIESDAIKKQIDAKILATKELISSNNLKKYIDSEYDDIHDVVIGKVLTGAIFIQLMELGLGDLSLSNQFKMRIFKFVKDLVKSDSKTFDVDDKEEYNEKSLETFYGKVILDHVKKYSSLLEFIYAELVIIDDVKLKMKYMAFIKFVFDKPTPSLNDFLKNKLIKEPSIIIGLEKLFDYKIQFDGDDSYISYTSDVKNFFTELFTLDKNKLQATYAFADSAYSKYTELVQYLQEITKRLGIDWTKYANVFPYWNTRFSDVGYYGGNCNKPDYAYKARKYKHKLDKLKNSM